MKLAAIHYRKGQRTDDLLYAVVHTLAAEGIALAAVLQHWLCVPDDPCAMELELFPDGERFSLSQALGKASTSCRLDPGAIARAAGWLRERIVTHRPQLVIINKFGEFEAAGEGLRDEIAFALEHGATVLTAVAEPWRAAWEDFTAGFAETLPAELDAVLAWCRQAAGVR